MRPSLYCQVGKKENIFLNYWIPESPLVSGHAGWRIMGFVIPRNNLSKSFQCKTFYILCLLFCSCFVSTSLSHPGVQDRSSHLGKTLPLGPTEVAGADGTSPEACSGVFWKHVGSRHVRGSTLVPADSTFTFKAGEFVLYGRLVSTQAYHTSQNSI